MQQLIEFLFENVLRYGIPRDFSNILFFILFSLVFLGTGGALQYFSFTRGRKLFPRILPFLCLCVLTLVTQVATYWADAYYFSGEFYEKMLKISFFTLPWMLLHWVTMAATLAWFACAVVFLVLSIKRLCTKILCRG